MIDVGEFREVDYANVLVSMIIILYTLDLFLMFIYLFL